MPLYRVTFHTEILVEAQDEREAERIGDRNLGSEVMNGGSEVWNTEVLESVDQLRRDERGSLPWRSSERRGEPELYVEEILERN
jgi:hypothetical protein